MKKILLTLAIAGMTSFGAFAGNHGGCKSKGCTCKGNCKKEKCTMSCCTGGKSCTKKNCKKQDKSATTDKSAK